MIAIHVSHPDISVGSCCSESEIEHLVGRIRASGRSWAIQRLDHWNYARKRKSVKLDQGTNNKIKFLKFDCPGGEASGLWRGGVSVRGTTVVKNRPSVISIDCRLALSDLFYNR